MASICSDYPHYGNYIVIMTFSKGTTVLLLLPPVINNILLHHRPQSIPRAIELNVDGLSNGLTEWVIERVERQKTVRTGCLITVGTVGKWRFVPPLQNQYLIWCGQTNITHAICKTHRFAIMHWNADGAAAAAAVVMHKCAVPTKEKSGGGGLCTFVPVMFCADDMQLKYLHSE